MASHACVWSFLPLALSAGSTSIGIADSSESKLSVDATSMLMFSVFFSQQALSMHGLVMNILILYLCM